MIYFGSNISVRVEGAVWRRWACEGCGSLYCFHVNKAVTRSREAPYMLNRNGAERAAREAAELALEDRFEKEVEPVPCPRCGTYQAEMVPAVCAQRFRWVSNCLLAALCLAPILFAAVAMGVYELTDMGTRKDEFLNDWLVVLVPAFCAAILPWILLKLYFRQKTSSFHPNLDLPEDERIALGRQLAQVLPTEEPTSEA